MRKLQNFLNFRQKLLSSEQACASLLKTECFELYPVLVEARELMPSFMQALIIFCRAKNIYEDIISGWPLNIMNRSYTCLFRRQVLYLFIYKFQIVNDQTQVQPNHTEPELFLTEPYRTRTKPEPKFGFSSRVQVRFGYPRVLP